MKLRSIVIKRSCIAQLSFSHSISHLLIFTCLLVSVAQTVQVPPGPLKPTSAPGGAPRAVQAVPPSVVGASPTQNAVNLGPLTKSIAPLLQAAMAVAPKVAPTPVAPSMQPTPVLKKSMPAIGLQQGSDGGGGQARLRGQINQEEPIIQLDYSSINDEILHKHTANFVYFNANFNQCRHCQRFFTIWKDLALDIRWWRNVIKLFTINCSDEDNIDVCRRAGVTQFPQLKFYWVMSNNLNQDGQRLRILGKSVHAMRHLIMDKVLDSYLEHNKLIAQRDRQRTSSSALSNPLSAILPGGPLSAFVPIMSQLMSNTSGASAPASGGLGGLTGLMGMLTGKPSAGGDGGASPGGGGLSLTSLMSSIGGMQGIGQVVNALVNVATWRRSLTLQALPSNWPKLEAISPADTQKLINVLPIGPGRASGALLIMETQEFLYTGLEVMLDLNPYTLNQTYYIERVRDERSQLCKNLTKLDDVQAPALIYVNELREPKLIMTAPKYTNDEDLRRSFVRAFERRQIKYPLKRVWSASTSVGGGLLGRASSNSSEADEEIISRVNDIYMNDLLNTIRSSLTDQVLRHPDLSDDQYNALVKYVYALINYFPFNNDEQLKFFKRLHTWLQNQVSPLDISEYTKQFHDVDDVLGKKRDWVACKSLSNVNSIPSRRKSGSLFENPSHFGKVVSNITRLFRANQQKVGQLKNLVGMFASTLNSPVVLTKNNNQQRAGELQPNRRLGGAAPTSTASPTISMDSPSLSPSRQPASSSSKKSEQKEESSLQKLIKSLTSGSLGSDSSILKLISTALGGGGDTKPGKSKFAREFSCGSWKLAHVMVVNEYIRDSPRKDVKHIVLHSLYQYMLHFYACPTCGNRVSDVSSEFRLNLNDHLLDQGDSIMLLWKVHNRVNKRLESEIRPGSPPKQQFPSETLCPKCRAPKKSIDTAFTPDWHEKQVLNFLVHHYRPQNIETNVDPSSTKNSSSSIPNLSLILSFLVIAVFWQTSSLDGCLIIITSYNHKHRSNIKV